MTALTAAPFMATIKRRVLVIVALCVTVIGDLGAAVARNYKLVLLSRLIAGGGQGADRVDVGRDCRQPTAGSAVRITGNKPVSIVFLHAMPALTALGAGAQWLPSMAPF